MSHSRYALYLTPPQGSDLWRFGSDVIGRDALTGSNIEAFAPEGHDVVSWRALTTEPRRYGFHATIKAPFRLRADLGVVDLIDVVAHFARSGRPFDMGELQIDRIATDDGRAFVALKPKGEAVELHAFEAKAVRALDVLRAPQSQTELRRREVARLTPRQRYYLEVWGYPYVIDEFRPHFTLTNAIADAKPAASALNWEFQMRVGSKALRVDSLTLFGEREKDGVFEILREFPLGHTRRSSRWSPRIAAAAFID
jgi:hypothetical protein